jgi:formylglycine-generating enzyme required for sulfatase activity
MCGGEVSNGETNEDGGSGAYADGPADAPAGDDVRRLPACGQFVPVPGGYVYVGAWLWVGGNIQPATTCDLADPGNRGLDVDSFSLMDLPVTNSCYQECVRQGACVTPTHDVSDPNPLVWDDPSRANEPAYVDHGTAQTFCTWLGGYLPSMAQVLRASQGMTELPSVGAMTAAAVDCFMHPDRVSPTCAQIASMNLANPANGLYPVGQVALDVGPYGHHDLFGEGYSWTRSFVDFTSPKFCALMDGDPDYVTFAEEPQFAAPQWATLEQATFAEDLPTINPGDVAPTDVSYQFSFRCAIDN